MVEHELYYSFVNHKVISIIYMKGMEIIQRRIQVLKIENKLIKALDIDKQEIRTFKRDNILSAMNTNLVLQYYSQRRNSNESSK